MSIFVIGINYKTASLAVREQIYFAQEKLPLYLQDILHRGIASEAVLLSTCNRSELYANAEDAVNLRDWFCSFSKELASVLYVYRDEEAVAHMMQVACGIDSMVFGEAQILGQMKDAFSESCAAGAVTSTFHRLFQQIFSLAKEIRTTTSIGACPVSLASAAVHFVKSHVVHLADSRVAVIGTGDMATLLVRYLKPHLLHPLMIVGRHQEKAMPLLEACSGCFYELDDVHHALCAADVVLSATGSAVPIIDKASAERIMNRRAQKAMVYVDLAVPRDIEASVAEVPSVALFCIDDLKAIIEKNRQGREHAAEKAREMIVNRSRAFFAESIVRDNVSHTIRAYRHQVEEICAVELQKAKQQLQIGDDPEQVLETFAYMLTQKLLHTPSVQLRQAGEEGRFDLLQFAKQLFAIPG